jgi:integrase
MKGHIRERSPGHWAIILDVYDAAGKRKRKWHSFKGTKKEARTECSRLITEMSKGEYVEASRLTVGQWIDQWIAVGAPGRKKKKVGQRTLERYEQLLGTHVKPVLGEMALQKLKAPAIDKLYADIEAAGKIAPRTMLLMHVVLGACLATAHRKAIIAANPMTRVERVPSAEQQVLEGDEPEDDIGEGLEETELKELVAGFKPSASMYAPVVVDAATGVRRNELLAFRWTDLDEEKKTLKVERAWEGTKKFGLRLKSPKTKRGFRTIDLDDGTMAVLLKEKEKLQRIRAGVPDGVDVDLSLIKLPSNALIFPAIPGPGEDFDFAKPRNPLGFTKEFARRAEAIGYGRVRFHDLRGIHSTALLDAGIPVHTVAQRIGDDPAVLLRNYAKRKRSKKADESVATAIAAFSATFLDK